MRTTVSIDDHLLARARDQARRRGQTLGQFIEEALGSVLAGSGRAAERPIVPVFTRGTGPRPGVDLSSNRAILEALDDETPLDQQR